MSHDVNPHVSTDVNPDAPPSSTGVLQRLAGERFVSLTTFRQTGQAVSTPVWVVSAPDRDELIVMTPADSGKVKRLRRDPRVQLRPCNRFGRVAPDAPVARGTAVLGPYHADLEQLFRAEYLEYRLVMAVERRGRGSSDRLAVRIRLTNPQAATDDLADDLDATPTTTSTNPPEENIA